MEAETGFGAVAAMGGYPVTVLEEADGSEDLVAGFARLESTGVGATFDMGG